jgi:hypothetical protein
LTCRSSGWVIAKTAPCAANGQYNQQPLPFSQRLENCQLFLVGDLYSIEALWAFFDFDVELTPLFLYYRSAKQWKYNFILI